VITLYDYLPSQNAYKVRLLLKQLQLPYRTELISIFEGEGQRRIPGDQPHWCCAGHTAGRRSLFS
jgi:hypothetical protein